MPRCLVAALVLTCLPLTATAQAWETYRHDAGHGAGICPVDDDATGDYFCFLISCAPQGGPLWIRVALAGTPMPEDSPSLTIAIDDTPPETRSLARTPGENSLDFGVLYDKARDGALLDSLASGRMAQITLGTGTAAVTHRISLSGSRRAIDLLPRLCPP